MNPGISIQPRDIQILLSLFESRILTRKHIATFQFSNKEEAAKKRIQQLLAAKLIIERRRRVNERSLLSISESGFRQLREQGKLTEYPRLSWSALQKRNAVAEITLKHELAILDVKAAFCRTLQNSTVFSLSRFTTWPALSQFEVSVSGPFNSKATVVKPDGFLAIREKAADGEFEHSFFAEIDLSTETLETVVNKCLAYTSYYRSGGFAVRNGGKREDFKDFPFRLLIVCRSKERCDNIARKLLDLHPPILSQVWLSVLDSVMADPLEPIWLEPRSLRDGSKKLSSLLDTTPEMQTAA